MNNKQQRERDAILTNWRGRFSLWEDIGRIVKEFDPELVMLGVFFRENLYDKATTFKAGYEIMTGVALETAVTGDDIVERLREQLAEDSDISDAE